MKFKILTATIILPCLLLGCVAGLVGDDGAKHISDNNTAARMHTSDNAVQRDQIAANTAAARAAAKVAAAQARADAKMHESSERTQQTLLVQNASAERLLIQSNHLMAVRAEGTQRFNTFLIVVVVLTVLGGGAFLTIYFWNNPRPVAYAQLPQQPQYAALPRNRVALPESQNTAIQTTQPVPYSTFVSNPRFAEHGWRVDDSQTGVREVNGVVVQTCRLLEG